MKYVVYDYKICSESRNCMQFYDFEALNHIVWSGYRCLFTTMT